jgi:hypothetical protein
MAEARIVKVPIRTRVQRVQLTLTEGEVDFLLGLMPKVGGNRALSPRKYAERIYKVLHEVTGQSYKDTDSYRLAVEGGRVNFAVYDSDPFIRERGKVRLPDKLPPRQ